jgi:putative FmdB family regulatory protein
LVYEYQCSKCTHRFDVTKSVKDIDVTETCPQCGEFAERKFVPSKVYFSGTEVQHAEYNPGLGCIVKSKHHRAELAKRQGVVEIGNDFKSPDAIHKKLDQERNEKKEQRYEQALKEI